MMNTPRKCKISGKKRNPIRPSRPHAARRLEFTLPKAEQSQETSTTSPHISVVETWSMEENKALVQFILFYGPNDAWPSHSKTSKFWNEAASYVQQVGGSQSLKRTGRRNQYQY